VLVNLGVAEYTSGSLAGAERNMRKALEVDPVEPFATTWLCVLLQQTGRLNEGMAMTKRLKEIAPSGFYITAYYVLVSILYFARNDLDAVEQLLREGRNQADENNLKAVEAHLAARRGRIDEAKRLLRELVGAPSLGAGSVALLVEAAVLAGDPDLAMPFAGAVILRDIVNTMARVEPAMHPLLDRPPLAPRKWDVTLVWPLEAPMMHPSVLPLFQEVRVESGLPQMSEVRSSAP
jgi:tetratricopeptide (TPR) repeat protein